MMDRTTLWNRAADFHGHKCPGLSIGFRAALYAIDLLELTFSDDEQVVCITENDACGVDAIQAILGCSVGKGNLLFHITGKQAFSFYNRKTGQSVRLVLNKPQTPMTREESYEYYHTARQETLFTVKPTTIALPQKAQLFESYPCQCCGEITAANWIRIQNGKKLCLDCCQSYNRFEV